MTNDEIDPLFDCNDESPFDRPTCEHHDWCDLRSGHEGPCLDDYGQDLSRA